MAVNNSLSFSSATGIIGLEAPNDLEQVILALSQYSEDDSLLRNPFNDIEIQEFVTPLTEEEQRRRTKLKILIYDINKAINEIVSLFPWFLDPYSSNVNPSAKQLIYWRDKREEYQIELNNLNNKEQQAYDQWLKERHDILLKNAANRRDVVSEFEGLVDKFEIMRQKGFTGITKYTRPEFERVARNYINDEPQIIFVSEYIVEDTFVGVLICIERYRQSTHYEFFKKSIFRNNAQFNRFLFLDSKTLQKETETFMPYVKNVLGFKDLLEDEVFIVLDTQLKKDRIYEYTVAAAKVPQSADELDYDLILESKEMLRETETDGLSSIFSYSIGVLGGSRDLAWAISCVNEGLSFFGPQAAKQRIRDIVTNIDEIQTPSGGLKIYIPKNVTDILDIYRESFHLFGIRNTFINFLQILGGLPVEIMQVASEAVDESSSTFSYDVFRNKLKEVSPIYGIILDVFSSDDATVLNAVADLGVSLPLNTGSESLTTILGLSAVLKFINNTYLSITYSRDESVFERISNVRALIAVNRGEDDPIKTVVQNIVAETEESSAINLFGVVGNVSFGGISISLNDDDDDDNGVTLV